MKKLTNGSVEVEVVNNYRRSRSVYNTKRLYTPVFEYHPVIGNEVQLLKLILGGMSTNNTSTYF